MSRLQVMKASRAGRKPFLTPGSAPQIVDRLTFAGNILETGTESYRLAHARAQLTTP